MGEENDLRRTEENTSKFIPTFTYSILFSSTQLFSRSRVSPDTHSAVVIIIIN